MTRRRAGTIAVFGFALVLPVLAQDQPSPAAAPAEGLVLESERTIDFTTDEVTWLS